jgi:hypothetical protein
VRPDAAAQCGRAGHLLGEACKTHMIDSFCMQFSMLRGRQQLALKDTCVSSQPHEETGAPYRLQ